MMISVFVWVETNVNNVAKGENACHQHFSNLTPPRGSQVLHGLIKGNFRNFPVPSHKAYSYQILHVTLSSGPSVRDLNYSPKFELIAKDNKFYILFCEIFRNLFVRTHGYQF